LVLYLNLNGFKQINDTLGHLAGDDLLKQFAGELRHGLRPAGTVGRMGEDEFVAVMDRDCSGGRHLCLEAWQYGARIAPRRGRSHVRGQKTNGRPRESRSYDGGMRVVLCLTAE
jgi:GGDEF domain-containing protein